MTTTTNEADDDEADDDEADEPTRQTTRTLTTRTLTRGKRGREAGTEDDEDWKTTTMRCGRTTKRTTRNMKTSI